MLPPAWWGVADPVAVPAERSVAALIGDRTLDAELAGLLWLLVEAGTPIVVAGPRASGRTTLLTALLPMLPPGARPLLLAGEAEDFAAIPEAVELGWRRERASRSPVVGVANASTVLLAAELGDRPPLGIRGERALIVLRALSVGYGLGATIEAASLEEAFTALRGPAVGAGADELAGIGVVLVLGERPPGVAPVVEVAHYVRPISRDPHGHVQRLPPAVLAACDAVSGRLEHYSWGVAAELADRTGRRAIELEREQVRRSGLLGRLAAAGVRDPGDVRDAIDGYRDEFRRRDE